MKDISVDAVLVFQGFPVNTVTNVFRIRTVKGDTGIHLDTIVESVNPDSNNQIFFSLNKIYEPPNDWIISADSFATTHTITEVEIKEKKRCKGETKEYSFLFDGQLRINREECVITP